ncbi:rRNA maturation RNase YbeY [Ahrensia sp. 13_GOM-1096m]|uniref:rRNA maturation RNase YbeY n=1 Tax=Ahrensia sp. 13_GOM-1096m TaxID=1380380 RepID=UPI0005541A74|nr:rRNA maturation RNase YbeY [Ahrensia sp. 13_GOM-1096m]
MLVEIDIAENAGDWPNVKDLVQRAITHVFDMLEMADVESELSLVLTDDTEVQGLNAAWRKKDKPTNVLSFPAFEIEAGQKPGPMLGDIVLAYETVKREAEQESKSFEDHTSHLIVHGLLHLLGYDHENDTEAEHMEGLETTILGKMGIDDPYAPDDVAR